MTVRPFVEALPEPKQKVVKKAIEETEEAEEAAEEQQEPTPPQKTAAAQNNEPRFMPFIRVDQIARASSPLIPGYPETARNAGIEGTVVLEVYIDEQGQVRKVNVRKGIGFGCDEAAIRKVRGTRFIPAQMNGRPVAVRQIITFEFRLE
jgi:protein TonB